MTKRLFVGSLSWDTTDASLGDFFSQAGNVVSANVVTDKFNNNRSKGFGFVEMSTEEEAQKAINELNGKDLDGRTINVSEARPKEERSDSFQRGGGGGGFQRRPDSRGRNDRGRGGRY